jgi:hypothetical protein
LNLIQFLCVSISISKRSKILQLGCLVMLEWRKPRPISNFPTPCVISLPTCGTSKCVFRSAFFMKLAAASIGAHSRVVLLDCDYPRGTGPTTTRRTSACWGKRRRGRRVVKGSPWHARRLAHLLWGGESEQEALQCWPTVEGEFFRLCCRWVIVSVEI